MHRIPKVSLALTLMGALCMLIFMASIYDYPLEAMESDDKSMNSTNFTMAGFGANARRMSTTSWQYCASEGQTCSFGNGNRLVKYGTGGKYSFGFYKDWASCSNRAFNDPIRGHRKSCYWASNVLRVEFCAMEGQWCQFSGQKDVAYGGHTSYTLKTHANGVMCKNDNFGDPRRGTSKICLVLV
mmetsp:Transcript_112296/g.204141  ORF Transcript_112296/g.204141 Transcript_112296/m.204141 type:complete len:184 (+) Transcript_112296:87-638(+)